MQKSEVSGKLRALAIQSHLRQFTPFRLENRDGWVLVFPEYKVAYIPIPKSANSSIRSALLPLIGMEAGSVEKIQAFQGFEKMRISRFIKNHYQTDWFVFTAVRNPYSRYVSAYLDKLVTRPEVLRPLRRMGLKKGDSFGKFMKMLSLWPANALNEHFCPQTNILFKLGPVQNMVTTMMEDLDGSWKDIQDRIETHCGIRPGSLQRRNSTKVSVDWREMYDAPTKLLADTMAASDFSSFGYEKKL